MSNLVFAYAQSDTLIIIAFSRVLCFQFRMLRFLVVGASFSNYGVSFSIYWVLRVSFSASSALSLILPPS